MPTPGADRVKAVWTGLGTGTITLGGAAPGEAVQGFPAALDGQVVDYLIKHAVAAESETGYGTYTSSTGQLTRTYRTFPTEGGAAVDFSAGTKHVYVAPLASSVLPFISTINPTVNDDISSGFRRGRIWINAASPATFILRDHAAGAADWVQIDAAGTGSFVIASEAEARAGTDNTKGMTPFRTSQHHESREAVASTSFDPTSVLVDDDRLYTDTYSQTGAVSFAKAGSGTFRTGKVVQVTFNSNGDALSWSADFEPLVLGGSLPSSLPSGEHTLLFTWHSGRSKIQVASNTTFGLLAGVQLVNYSEITASQSGVTGALTLNYAAGQKQTVTFGAGNITSVTITNWPASGLSGTLTVDYVQDGVGGRTLADPANSSWFGGNPTYNTAAGTRNRVTYTTEDAGASVLNHYAGDL